jgi:predicted ATPase
MRIDKIHIKSQFKNLNNFKIDLDESSMETVLIGLNATGKSNLMEVIVVIFRDLDLERIPQGQKNKSSFDYYIKYKCRKNTIEVEYLNESGYSFKINNNTITRAAFFRDKVTYLPNHVFVYYSGISERLKDLYSDHTKKYYDEIIKPDAKHKQFDTLPKIFLVQPIHTNFALIAFYMFKDQEKETIQFLREEMKIHDFGSALFTLKQPTWSKSRKEDHDRFWGATGLVRRFLEDLYRFSLAPIEYTERRASTYKKNETINLLYLYIKDRETFQELVNTKMYSDKISLFNALNSIEISDMLDDVKIKVKKEFVNGELSMGELSEGEKQLLTVLGMLKFTKDEETLVLLDEPDTHLNPMWKWKYLEYLDNVVKKHETTQIIFCTHDPLVIGSMDNSQVRVFKRDKKGNTTAFEPETSPKGLGVAGILTSELFGMPTILDKETQIKLNRKRELQGQIMRSENMSTQDIEEYESLKAELEELGFYEEVEDQWYRMYLKEISNIPIFQQVEFTESEKQKLESESKAAIQRVLNKINNTK